ncbi:serine hydrolase [Oceanobacillus massiliensis]|uniref:serine hydrolase n=1 Tax=Oceanobacillus massiliensis TaxID=1465765 RepID=UPI003016AC99
MDLNQLNSALLSLSAGMEGEVSIAIHTDEGSIGIDADVPRKAASVAKLFILGEAYRRLESNLLSFDKLVYIDHQSMVGGSGVISYLKNAHVYSYQNLIELMIIVSDNTASNALLDAIGMEDINHFSKSIGCQHTIIERKFMDIEAAEKGKDNITTANDVVCLLKLFSRENDYFPNKSRREILRILGDQQFNNKLSTFNPNTPNIRFYRKTGELQGVEHDAAIIEANGKRIEAAILTEGWKNNGTGQHYIAEVGQLIIDYLID